MATLSLLRSTPRTWMTIVFGLCVGAGIGFLFSQTQHTEAKPKPAQAREESIAQRRRTEDEQNTIAIFRQMSPSVVFITNKAYRQSFFSANVTEIPQGSGSGFVWDINGHIVTNYHVISGANAVSVTTADGQSYDASYVGADPYNDLAVLKIETGKVPLLPVRLADSSKLVVGQKVLAIGNPFGLDLTLTQGIISALDREIFSVGGTTIRGVIQTDASINPGNSGGPLLDSAGDLIGINTAIKSPSGASAGIGFAVPARVIKRVVPQLIEYGAVRRAGLGILAFPDSVASNWRIEGVIIRSVLKGGGAALAGLRGTRRDRLGRIILGDVIKSIAGKPVRSFDDLFSLLDGYQAGQHVDVVIQREGETFVAKVKLQLNEG